MTTATGTKLLTADDLLRLDSRGVRGELIRGVLYEIMPAGLEHGEIVMNLGAQLWNFIQPRRLGCLTASDTGVWLERDPDTVRSTDVAFFSAEKLPPGVRVVGYAETVPDLVAEVVSPLDSLREVRDKVRMWLCHGVRLVWVVNPDARTVDVYRSDLAVSTVLEDGFLDGADVLPGFSCAVSGVFTI